MAKRTLPEAIKRLGPEEKSKLLSFWVTPGNWSGSESVNIALEEMSRLKEDVYEENKIKLGYMAADLLATTEVIKLFFK